MAKRRPTKSSNKRKKNPAGNKGRCFCCFLKRCWIWILLLLVCLGAIGWSLFEDNNKLTEIFSSITLVVFLATCGCFRRSNKDPGDSGGGSDDANSLTNKAENAAWGVALKELWGDLTEGFLSVKSVFKQSKSKAPDSSFQWLWKKFKKSKRTDPYGSRRKNKSLIPPKKSKAKKDADKKKEKKHKHGKENHRPKL